MPAPLRDLRTDEPALIPSDADAQRHATNLWYQVFAVGHPTILGKHRWFGSLPLPPRCRMCRVPFRGVGWVMRRAGWRPCPRNEDYCSTCDTVLRGYLANDAAPRGADLPLAIVYTDLRRSTATSERVGPREFAELRATYRANVARALRRANGFILEEKGDEVVGVFPPGFFRSRGDYLPAAARCAAIIATSAAPRVRAATGLEFGTGVHVGIVHVSAGFRPTDDALVVEVTGPPINVAARLADEAAGGEVLVSEALAMATNLPAMVGRDAITRELVLDGVSRPVRAISLRPGAQLPD